MKNFDFMGLMKQQIFGQQQRAQVRKLLKSPNPDVVSQACELMLSLAETPEMKLILLEMLEGVKFSESGKVDFQFADFWKRCKVEFRETIGWYLLWASGKLQELTVLTLSFNTHVSQGRSGLLFGVTLQDIFDAIAQSKVLKSLDLHLCPVLENVDFLIDVTSLTELNIWNSCLQNVDGIRNLTKLKTLKIDARCMNDLSALSGMSELQELVLYGANVEHLNELSSCRQLTTLYLDHSTL